jgi:hypothetical protein
MRSDLGIGAISAGVGAGLMFLLDPALGRGRRALIRDKGVRLANTTASAVDKTSRDAKNRIHGVVVTLQGGGQSGPNSQPAILQRSWPPAVRFAMGTAGSIATAAGIAKRGVAGSIIAGLGAGITAMAITNFSIRDFLSRDKQGKDQNTRRAG